MNPIIETYEEDALRTLGPHNDLLYLTIGLVGEVGEVIDYTKKTLYHGHKYEASKMAEEIGDVLWYTAAICHNRGFSFVSIVEKSQPTIKPLKEKVFDPQKILHLSCYANPEHINETTKIPHMKLLLSDFLREVREIALMAHLEFEDILDMNIKKLKKRYPHGYSHTSSVERVDHGR